MAVREFLILRLDGPMQAWGDVAVDSWRPTRSFPSLSALAGMLASALGWTYHDAPRTNLLQDGLQYAVMEERAPTIIQDFHTADLGRIGIAGWTRWGIERRGGANATGTQPQKKQYLADGSFIVALSLDSGSPVSVNEVRDALLTPARPLFLGRKGCLPASQIFVDSVRAESCLEALAQWATSSTSQEPWQGASEPWCWYAAGEGPSDAQHQTVWDRRDFIADRFADSRTISRRRLVIPGTPNEREQAHGK